MIDADFLKNKLKDAATQAKTEADLANAISEHLKFASEHYEELTPEAKELIDKQIKLLEEANDEITKTWKSKPDSLDKRKALRLSKQVKNEHFDLNTFLDSLNKAPNPTTNLAAEAKEIFIFIGQTLLNYLSDVSDSGLKSADMAKLGLLFSAIDEIVVAYHLAEHRFAPQSIAHTRIVLDIIDKIELFNLRPELIKLWAGEDTKERWEELKPAAVRKKLGKPARDEYYSKFSEMGSTPLLSTFNQRLHKAVSKTDVYRFG